MKVKEALEKAIAESSKPGFSTTLKPYSFYKILAEAGLIDEAANGILDDTYYDDAVVCFALKCIRKMGG